MAFSLIAWLKKLTLPPAGPLLLALCSLALPEPWRLVGVAAGLSLLWLASTPLVGLFLLRRLERRLQAGPGGRALLDLESFEADTEHDAVVVLDGGRYHRRGDEPAGASGSASGDVKPETLERLRHAAKIARRTELPILATGDGAGALMGTVLEEDFDVQARWLETASRNTQENATLSAALLEPDGRRRIVLVTHAWHMPRARRAFERTGLEVVPAPCAFVGPDRQELRLLALVPSAGGLFSTWRALHEWIGLAWYAWRYRRLAAPPTGERGGDGAG